MRSVWILIGAGVLAGCMPAQPQQPVTESPVVREPWIKQSLEEETALPKPGPVPAMEVSPALRQSARQELDRALASNDPLIRMHAIEAVRNALGSGGRDAILKALDDPEPGVRFAAATAAGELRIAQARPRLMQLLKDVPPPNTTDEKELAKRHVQMAAIFALHRMGDTRFSSGLELALKDTDKSIRSNAVFLLGRLEEKSAVKVLRPLLVDDDIGVRVQVAEALWRLGDSMGLEPLVGDSISRNPDIRMAGLLALAAPKDGRVITHIRASLFAPYEEVKLVAARAMGMLSNDEGFVLATEATHSPEARQRYLAAMALGAIARPDAQDALGALLKDSDADVRLAAATAILQLHDTRQTSANRA